MIWIYRMKEPRALFHKVEAELEARGRVQLMARRRISILISMITLRALHVGERLQRRKLQGARGRLLREQQRLLLLRVQKMTRWRRRMMMQPKSLLKSPTTSWTLVKKRRKRKNIDLPEED